MYLADLYEAQYLILTPITSHSQRPYMTPNIEYPWMNFSHFIHVQNSIQNLAPDIIRTAIYGYKH